MNNLDYVVRIVKYELDEMLGEVITKAKFRDMIKVGHALTWVQNGYFVKAERLNSETVIVFLCKDTTIYYYQ